MTQSRHVRFAFALGIATHVVFAFSVILMVVALYSGLRIGRGQFHGWHAVVANILLIVQFPIIHSFFLTKRGRGALAKIMPGGLGIDLSTTTFAFIAALQLLAPFALWSPSGITFYEATGAAYWVVLVLFIASWLFLIKALSDAGLGLQTGYTGWSAVVRNERPNYGHFPTHGLFRACRHPVYLGFALVMWTVPAMTLDGLLLAVVWTLYCVIGPRFKEKRYRARYGDHYERYCASVPFMLPGARRLPRDWASQDA